MIEYLYSGRTDLGLLDVMQALVNSAKSMDSMAGKAVSRGILDIYGAITFFP